MKTVIGALLGSVFGILLGAGGMHQWLMPKLLESNARYAEVEHDLAALQSASGGAVDALSRLEAERTQFNKRLAALQAELDAAKKADPVTDASVALPAEDALADAAALDVETASTAPAEDGDRRQRGDRGDRFGGTPEEREARRQEFVTRMQDNMANFFTGELEKSNTPEMQERLVTLEQKTQEMLDLRTQMRMAETDEEREALGQAFGETMAAAREIMQEQQRDMLGAIANQFGISGESDQAAFEQAIRSAVESPMFSDNPGALLWSAGRQDDGEGGGGPGRGGFGGGGFGGGGGSFRGGAPR